jgi:4-amino-4-deoxy-L-arabinose transferase-like glycosyltransferase
MKNFGIFKFWKETLLVIFALVVARLLMASLASIVFYGEVDEGQYFYYALKVMLEGIPAFKDILNTYIANSSIWGLPVPMRFGFIIVSSFFCGVFGTTYYSLVFLSCSAFFAAVFFSYWLSRRIFGQNVAFLAGLLFLASPLSLALSRRALSDSCANFFLLSAVLLQIDYYVCGRPIWKKWMLVAVFFLALAFKESNILFIIPLAASSLAFFTLKDFRLACRDWFIIYVLPVLTILIVYKILFVNLGDVFAIFIFLPSAVSQYYVANYQSGPWFRYLMDFLLISPWVMILGIYYTIHIFSRFHAENPGPEADAVISARGVALMPECSANKSRQGELALALFVVTTIFVFSFFPKNLRYISVLDYPLRVFTVMALFNARRKGPSFLIVFIVIAFICLADMANCFSIFVQGQLYDPVSFGLLSFWNIIPS